jgi:hypothetical protein
MSMPYECDDNNHDAGCRCPGVVDGHRVLSEHDYVKGKLPYVKTEYGLETRTGVILPYSTRAAAERAVAHGRGKKVKQRTVSEWLDV